MFAKPKLPFFCINSPIFRVNPQYKTSTATATHLSTTHLTWTTTTVFKRRCATTGRRDPKFEGVKNVVNLVSTGSPIERYNHLVEMGAIRNDEHQRKVIQELERLYKATKNYEPPLTELRTVITRKKKEHKGLLGWLNSKGNEYEETVTQEKHRGEIYNTPMGLYLYGDVGSGKTFLMDLFYSSCTHIIRKRRIHFHAFMLEVHDRIHIWRQKKVKEQKERSSVQRLKKTKEELEAEARDTDTDPIPPLADEFANSSWLLCFDEFQVTDIADAMILYRLFDNLFQRGVVLVTTSNRVPDDLYKGGLQRRAFLPFIDILKQKAVIYNIDSAIDYRLTGTVKNKVYFYPLNDETKMEIDTLFETLTLNQKFERAEIEVYGRLLVVEEATVNGIAKITFDELCSQALGSADYIALSKRFHTIFLYNIPKMSFERKNEAKRFIVLIDALYENQVKLICSAAAPAEEIFSHNPKDYASSVSELLDSLNVIASKSDVTMFSGEEEVFQFQRAVSRLNEMQSLEYLEKGRTGEI